MVERTTYKPKQFKLSGLKGISDKTLQMHFKLYEGYVKSVNELNEKIAEVLADGKVDKKNFRPTRSSLGGLASSITAWSFTNITSII